MTILVDVLNRLSMPRSRNLFLKVTIYSLLVYCIIVFGYGIHRRSIQCSQHIDVSNYFSNKEVQLNIHRKKEWTVMLSVNNGYQDFFLNWLAAYNNAHLMYPIIVVAEDSYLVKNIEKYKTKQMRFIESNFPPINASVRFGSQPFNELSMRRHTYILKELERGSNIIFSDTDTVWLENPVPYFTGNYDMWMQMDSKIHFCPGTMAVKSSEITISFFKNLTRDLKLHPQADQPYLNILIRKSDVRVASLSTNKFPSGRQYFEEFSSANRSKVVVVHNNWIKGHTDKLNRFKKFNIWFLK